MKMMDRLRGWLVSILSSKAKEEFDVQAVTSPEMDGFLRRCARVYQGCPDWLDPEQHIKTINFAKSVCAEVARLTTLAVGITVSGSGRADWLQSQIDSIYFNLRRWVEYGNAYGTVILKPNGDSLDVVFPWNFIITDCKNGEITGAVFQERKFDRERKKWYTRLEHHHFLDNGHYAVSNRCFMGETKNDPGRRVPIEKTPWAELAEDVELEGVEKPLFGIYRTPLANNIELDSPLGMPVFSDALEELEDLDVAYSRNAKEVFDSKRIVLLDSDRLSPFSETGKRTGGLMNSVRAAQAATEVLKLPDFVKTVEGGVGKEETDVYHEINPTLETEKRLTGLNALLSQIGYKCGFSNGYFVFNERSGMVTATQVEADDRRTIQLIKDMRDSLENCLNGLLYALDKFADLYSLAPLGVYEVTYDFGDITYNREEDRARWQGYVSKGWVPPWYYLNKFEGLPEKEAKQLISEAQDEESPPFGEEE